MKKSFNIKKISTILLIVTTVSLGAVITIQNNDTAKNKIHGGMNSFKKYFQEGQSTEPLGEGFWTSNRFNTNNME